MPASPPPESNAAIGRRIQEKFELYFLGLIFTVLGLSIQTARFGVHPVADSFEILGWLCFLVSGFAGLYRMERLPILYNLFHAESTQEQLVTNAQEAQLKGAREFQELGTKRMVSVESYVQRAEAIAADAKTKREPIEKRIRRAYQLMAYGFLGGASALIVARAFGPVRGILEAL